MRGTHCAWSICVSHRAERTGAFGKTFFSELEHPNVDAELLVIEETLKALEETYLSKSKARAPSICNLCHCQSHTRSTTLQFIGGDVGPSIADLLVCSELIHAQSGRLVSDLFNFPRVATVMQAVRSLPGSQFVFAELEAFAQALPPVKSAQITIRGNREVLKVGNRCTF